MAINVATLVGRITTKPEIKIIGESQVTNFNIAVGAGKDKSYFFKIVAFNKIAQLFTQCNKGDLVGISGRLQQRTFERADGQKGESVEIVANDMSFLTPKPTNEKPHKSIVSAEEIVEEENDEPQDLPF